MLKSGCFGLPTEIVDGSLVLQRGANRPVRSPFIFAFLMLAASVGSSVLSNFVDVRSDQYLTLDASATASLI